MSGAMILTVERLGLVPVNTGTASAGS